MYSTIWAPVLRELLSCIRELDNAEDRYVVTVCRVNSVIISHIPKKMSFLCAVFIKRGGTKQFIVSAIHCHILPHHDLLFWHCKIVRTLLFFGGFTVTAMYQFPCWPPQLNSKESVYLMDHGNLDVWEIVTFSFSFEVL